MEARRRFWIEEEIEYLKENYGKERLEVIAGHLNRSTKAVQEKFYSLKDKKTSKKLWSEKDIKYLKENYGKKSVNEICKKLNRSGKAVDKMRRKIGLGPVMRKKWTDEEIEYLKMKWGSISISAISKKLGRKEGSVYKKGLNIGLGSLYFSGHILTTADVAKMLNINDNTVRGWIFNKKLKASKKKFINKSMYDIKWDDLIEFLKLNQNSWSANYLEYNILGVEEDWLKKKRKDDYLNFKGRKCWSTNEIKKLKEMLNSGASTESMVRTLNRSKNSIYSKISQLNKLNDLDRKKYHRKPWSKKEISTLKKLRSQGYTFTEIGKILNRNPKVLNEKFNSILKK